MTDLSRDDFLGGRLRLWQPVTGYRAGVDPVLLAAAVTAQAGQDVLELGCGVGAAALCLATRVPGVHVTGVEVQPDYAGLARRNATDNDLDLAVVTADLRTLPNDLRQRQFHHVMMNPPYLDRRRGNASDDGGRDLAFAGQTPLADWIDVGLRRVRPKGTLSLIQRIDRLPDCLTALAGRLGGLVLCPIAGRTGRAPDRFLLRGTLSARAPFRQTAPLILHEGAHHDSDRDSYTPEIQAVLRDAAALPIWN